MLRSSAQAAGAKLKKVRKLTGHELPLLKRAAQGPFKITLPAPSNFVLASYKPGVTDAVYATHADLLRDLVATAMKCAGWITTRSRTTMLHG